MTVQFAHYLNAAPSPGALAGMCRFVATHKNRNKALWWAGIVASEKGYPDAAYDVLQDVARDRGLAEWEIAKALRMRPSRQGVRA